MFVNPRIGIRNLGDTCYLNVSLQIFLACHTTRHYIESATTTMALMAKLFRHISSVPMNSVISPHEFIYSSLSSVFHPCEGQHDVPEFLLYLLNSIVVDDYVRSLFQHVLSVTTTCDECRKTSLITTKDFLCAVATTSKHATIQDAITSAQLPHTFERMCDSCTGTSSTQRTRICPSQVLLVHIKRFAFDSDTRTTSKLYGTIRISHTLTFADVSYQLRLVVLHVGDVHGGHYICDILDSTGDRISIDDSRTGEIPLARALNVTPYVLMYVRL